MRKHVLIVACLAVLVACKKKKEEPKTDPTPPAATADAATTAEAPADAAPAEPPKAIAVTLPADLKWMPFDEKAPAGPAFAVAYGNPMEGPAGMFVKLPKGDKGTPHTHTNAYHGVSVLGGVAHQQDGAAKQKELPPGSYWFEPGGAAHTSHCPGKAECVGFIHFNDGKFDFAPAKLDPKGKANEKYVEKRPADLKFAPLMPDMKDKGPQIATAWGDGASGPHGTFWKLPAGFTSPAHTHTADYHAVVIKGTVLNHAPDDKAPKEMGAGAFFTQPGGVAHITACKAGAECLMYSYMTGKFDFVPSEAAAPAGGSAAPAGGSAAPAGDMKKDDKKKEPEKKM